MQQADGLLCRQAAGVYKALARIEEQGPARKPHAVSESNTFENPLRRPFEARNPLFVHQRNALHDITGKYGRISHASHSDSSPLPS